jgi:PhzF family phenazine biosynthesis protein
VTRVRVFHVNAFTRHAYRGNPAGVVLDAERLDERQMQLLARELNLGDTVFLLPADGADHDLRARFFTPRLEVGFVGHATVAAHALLAAQGLAARHRQKQGGDIVAIERQADTRGMLISFTQPPPQLRGAIETDLLASLLAALGIEQVDLDPRCPATVAGNRSTRNLIAVRDGAVLARLRPDLTRLAALSAAGSAPGTFVYTLRPAIEDCETEARMFCPALGIPEDPVSGNAHAMLAAFLCSVNMLPGDATNLGFHARQGHHMGRAGELQISVQRDGGTVHGITVRGSAVVVYETSVAVSEIEA